MKMYWVESVDHGEDWFIVAKSPKSAIKYFCSEMGYDPVDDGVSTEFVCDVPECFCNENPQFAFNDIVEACGGTLRYLANPELLKHYSPQELECIGSSSRVVTLFGKTYVEGSVANVVIENLAKTQKWN